ncbi:hypothetical protein, partial [Escherichia coli]|uniref:hypothetical protein n=2 Tax=Escherichia coli TaxID=562 RepID=UPI001BC882BD
MPYRISPDPVSDLLPDSTSIPGPTRVRHARQSGQVYNLLSEVRRHAPAGTVAKLAMRQPFVLFKGLTFQKLCLPGAFRPGDHHNKMLRG